MAKLMASVALALATLACSTSPEGDATSAATLLRGVGERTWTLSEFVVGGDDIGFDAAAVSLRVTGPAQVGGSTGCGAYTAQVALYGTRSTTTDVASDSRPCSTDAATRLESLFLAALVQGGDLYLDTTVAPAQLVISLGDATSMRFTAST